MHVPSSFDKNLVFTHPMYPDTCKLLYPQLQRVSCVPASQRIVKILCPSNVLKMESQVSVSSIILLKHPKGNFSQELFTMNLIYLYMHSYS